MAEIEAGEYIDTYVNLSSKEPQPESDMDPNIRQWFRKSSTDLIGGVTTEHWVNKMTAAGIERGLLNFSLTQGMNQPMIPKAAQTTLDEFRARCEEVATICKAYPDRIFGTCNIDSNRGMNAVHMVEIAIKESGFRAVRMMGALTDLRPIDTLCFPIYIKCIDLNVPVVINVGFPGPLRYAKYQRPIGLDDVCVTYPELAVVATHIDDLCHLETVALLQKHATFRFITSVSYLPRRHLATGVMA